MYNVQTTAIGRHTTKLVSEHFRKVPGGHNHKYNAKTAKLKIQIQGICKYKQLFKLHNVDISFQNNAFK